MTNVYTWDEFAPMKIRASSISMGSGVGVHLFCTCDWRTSYVVHFSLQLLARGISDPSKITSIILEGG